MSSPKIKDIQITIIWGAKEPENVVFKKLQWDYFYFFSFKNTHLPTKFDDDVWFETLSPEIQTPINENEGSAIDPYQLKGRYQWVKINGSHNWIEPQPIRAGDVIRETSW